MPMESCYAGIPSIFFSKKKMLMICMGATSTRRRITLPTIHKNHTPYILENYPISPPDVNDFLKMGIPSCLTTFQKLPLTPHQTQTKDPNYWNSVIKHQTKLKNDLAILTTYTHMESLGILPDNTTLPLVFKACTKLKAIDKGKRIHSTIRGSGLIEDVRVRTGLVDFYSKCGFLEDARYVFDGMGERDVVLWNAMISGYVGMGCNEEAVLLFMEMGRESLRPNSRTVVALLLACGELLDLRMGKEVHGYCVRNGLFDADGHVGTALSGFYLRFDLRVSRNAFDLMDLRNTVSWNSMISGYFDVGECLEALKLFIRMLVEGVEFDPVTVLVVTQACAEFESLKLGMQIHQLAIKCEFNNDLFIVNALINMYSKNGSLESSLDLFESVTIRDVALWNSMLSSNIEFRSLEEATSLFIRMRTEGIKEDETTIGIMLSICADLPDGLRNGRSLHAHVIKSGVTIHVSLGNALLSMYAELNCVEAVQKIFSEMGGSDVISWNTSMLALGRSNLRREAWELFRRMEDSEITPNSHSMIAILASCRDENYLNIGRSIHGYVIKHRIHMNLSLNTALIDMYMTCGDEATAINLFEGCLEKDVISWNALISSYVKNNQAHKALLLFNSMVLEAEPNSVTIINLLAACTCLADLPQGQCLHAYTLRRESSSHFSLSLTNALITMYVRCGSMQNAEKIFKALPRRDVISWNAMIAGYGTHGDSYDAMLTFSRMLEDGFQPNGVTFVSLLSACSHSGLVEQGLHLFQSMIRDFNIIPELNHYGCLVDLLGRGGCLNEAREFLNSIPIEPDASLWRSLLSACRNHCDTELAGNIFKKLVELEPMNEGNYVLLSNIYAAAGLWSEVKKLRSWLKENSLSKPPGISWITVKSQIHSFMVGDKSHPESDKIYAISNSLLSSMKEIGYVPDFHWVLHDEED